MCVLCYHLLYYPPGDDGEGEEPCEDRVVRRADNSFTVWASGRVGCDGLLVHLDVSLVRVCTVCVLTVV